MTTIEEQRTVLRGRIPKHFTTSLDGYLNHGVPLSGVLKLIATNDLQGTFSASFRNTDILAALPDLMVYFLNYVPAKAWGSPQVVDSWKGLQGAEE